MKFLCLAHGDDSKWNARTPGERDGPSAETREHLGGFFLVEARDMAEAVQRTSKSPPARPGEHLGWRLEVRQIDETFH